MSIEFLDPENIGFDTKFVVLACCNPPQQDPLAESGNFGRHLEFIKFLKGENSTPTWICEPRPPRY